MTISLVAQQGSMKILFLTTVLPRMQRMGSEVASQCFIDALKKVGYEVSILGYLRKDDVFQSAPDEISIGKRYIETKKARFYPIIWLILSLLKRLPYSAAKYYSRAYIKKLDKLLSIENYDVVVIDHPQLGWLEPFIKKKDRLVTLAHNIEHEIYLDSYKDARNFISRWVYKREACTIKAMEDKLATIGREIWTLTEHDSKYFSSLKGVGKVRAFDLPPGLAKLQNKPISKDFDIGLIGSWSWKPNEEGLRWFLKHVYPYIPSNLSIHVAGRGAEWLMDKYPNIHYRGFVPDAQEFMAQARVVAIPILAGSGIQIKTLDAIASGSTVVATPVALRGIANPPQTVQVAEQPEDFAHLLVSAASSPASQQALDNASNWFTARREQFIADITRAISELCVAKVRCS